MNRPTLKKGDQVVMHTCMEHDHPDNFGKIWTCRSDEFQHKGHDYGSVFLEGFSGSFSTEYLQVINLPGVVKRLKEENERLEKRMKDYEHQSLRNAVKVDELTYQLQDALNTLNTAREQLKEKFPGAATIQAYKTIVASIDRLQGSEQE